MKENSRTELIAELDEHLNPLPSEVLRVVFENAGLCAGKEEEAVCQLLKRYPSPHAVMCADIEELDDVFDTGENIGGYLCAFGTAAKKLIKDPECINSAEEFVALMRRRFHNKSSEAACFYFVGAHGKIKRILSYTTTDSDMVEIDMSEVMRSISAADYSGLYIAHNHINSPSTPSREDDKITAKIAQSCRSFGKELLEHCIINDIGEVFRYVESGRINTIL